MVWPYRQRPPVTRQRVVPAPQFCLHDRQKVQGLERIVLGRDNEVTQPFCLGEFPLVIGRNRLAECFRKRARITCRSRPWIVLMSHPGTSLGSKHIWVMTKMS